MRPSNERTAMLVFAENADPMVFKVTDKGTVDDSFWNTRGNRSDKMRASAPLAMLKVETRFRDGEVAAVVELVVPVLLLLLLDSSGAAAADAGVETAKSDFLRANKGVEAGRETCKREPGEPNTLNEALNG